ncbi:NADP-dependent oxidoreductase [Halorientalis marina]|uniref:NADP-dependent oxidoreductase n=1 Tax=Halorientalis marina TaxID=2931976 RepID=UPI0021136ECB|nr:NADP-dependent oxidoreductase [Halorientalis marina]
MTDPVNRQWALAKRPEGMPCEDTFELRKQPVQEPGPDEVLVKTHYLSVDPYMRDRMRAGESYAKPWDVGEVMEARVVGEVQTSKHPEFEKGDVVSGMLHWAEFTVVKGAKLTQIDLEGIPVSTAVGVVGMPGRTAYFGMLDVVDPNPGETVVVSGAAGAVGSVAGQIAKLNGCRVVGIAGSDEKITCITDEFGFDVGINYKSTEDIESALAEACPDGVDAYFDNVGGKISDAVVRLLNEFSSVAVCGQIALYNEEETPTGPRHWWTLIEKRARVEGFLQGDYSHRNQEAIEQLVEWVSTDAIQYRETVIDGLENAPSAFLGLFEGQNIGKQLVKVN